MINYLLIIIPLFYFQLTFQISGKYKVEFDKKYYPNGEANFIINFTEKNYIKSDSIRGGITRNRENSKTVIHLQDFAFTHPKAEINNSKPKGKIIIEFEESHLDTILFRTTYTKQLDRTINTGKLIKIK